MSYGFTPETDAERSTAPVQPDAWFPAVTADECASLLSIDDTVSNAILNNCLALAVDDVIFNLQTWAENQQADGAEFADDPRRVTRYKNAVYNATKALILRDADRLDALGAVGIARTFMVAGTIDRPFCDPDDPFAARRDLDDQLWSIDHWHLKLLKLPGDMATDKGRKIARKRARLMLAYLRQLAKEMDTDLPDHWAKLLQ